jgi:hypothetical protein
VTSQNVGWSTSVPSYNPKDVVAKLSDTTVEITELPIHKWTQTYKAELEVMIGDKGDGTVKVCWVEYPLLDGDVEFPVGL